MLMAPHLTCKKVMAAISSQQFPACESAATHEDTAFHVRQRLFGEAAVVETLLGSWVHSQIGKKTPGRSHLCHSCDHMPPVASRTVGRFPKIQASLNHPYHFRIYDFSLSIQLLGYPWNPGNPQLFQPVYIKWVYTAWGSHLRQATYAVSVCNLWCVSMDRASGSAIPKKAASNSCWTWWERRDSIKIPSGNLT